MEKYPSKYSNGNAVSGAQYITELICENKARMVNKDLHYKFWTEPYWAKFFRNQIASANKLIKQFDPMDIAKALKTEMGKKIFSLRAPHLPKMIEVEQKKRASLEKVAKPKDRLPENPVVKKHVPKSNILDLLEE